jgi:hypothetical protein
LNAPFKYVEGGIPMRSDADFEQELDNLSFAAQRDLLMLRLAHVYSLTSERRRERCLASLSKLRDLLTEIEAFLLDGQEGEQQQKRKSEADCIP